MSNKPEAPKILKRKVACQSRLFRVEEIELRFSNGEQRSYERLASGPNAAVLVVAMPTPETVLMIREYGVGLEDYELTFPKGKVDKGEAILDAANRELKEECGFGARELIPLKVLSQSPSYMQHKTQVVLARDLYPETLEGDEPEEIIVEEYNLSEMNTLIEKHDFTEARSLAALFIVKSFLDK